MKGEADCGNFLQLGEDLIRVTGYRERIIDFSVLLLFYSSGERFFMGEYLFSTKEKSAWRQIASSICKKYDLTDCEEFRHFYIEDGKGSFLCLYDDGFSINIKFFNPVHCQPFDKLHAIFQPSKANLQSPSMELSSKILADRL